MDYRQKQILLLTVASVLVAAFLAWRWTERDEVEPFLAEARATGKKVHVEVSGKGVTPGVYVFDPGVTVRDVLSEARCEVVAELPGSGLDLPVLDGTSLEVFREPGGPWQLAHKTMEGHSLGLLFLKQDVNIASEADLQAIPGVGEATAREIVSYRTQHGPFRRVEDLDQVKGIGPKTVEKLREYLEVK